jgi:hypothetical protein
MVTSKSQPRDWITVRDMPTPPEPCMFDVHLFSVVRITVPCLEADSPAEAVAKAVQQCWDSLYQRFDSADTEFAEEFSYFLVDVLGKQRITRGYLPKEDLRIDLLIRLLKWFDRARDDKNQLASIISAARDIVNEAV